MPASAPLQPLAEDTAFWMEQGQIMRGIAAPLFRKIFLMGAEAGSRETPVRTKDIPFDFEAINSAADEIIADYTDEWWEALERSTRQRLREAIAEARALGEGADFVADAIEDLFGSMRATRIAVSETTTLLGQGAQETYRRAGFTGWIWRTANDDVVDQICNDLKAASDPALGGKPFPMSRTFFRAHVNCRCWPVPAGDVVTLPAAA